MICTLLITRPSEIRKAKVRHGQFALLTDLRLRVQFECKKHDVPNEKKSIKNISGLGWPTCRHHDIKKLTTPSVQSAVAVAL